MARQRPTSGAGPDDPELGRPTPREAVAKASAGAGPRIAKAVDDVRPKVAKAVEDAGPKVEKAAASAGKFLGALRERARETVKEFSDAYGTTDEHEADDSRHTARDAADEPVEPPKSRPRPRPRPHK